MAHQMDYATGNKKDPPNLVPSVEDSLTRLDRDHPASDATKKRL